ncbi:MAG: LysE family transporter [Saprospiraceae bacterium]|nr:LysE family transporter [Saprospiraceae bacterium]
MEYLSLISQGLFLGLALAVMTGPIFVTLIQIALEKGFRAGIVACTGEWISDFIIIGLGYFFIQRINTIVEDSAFTYWMGLLGGIILILFGVGALLKKVNISFNSSSHTANDYFSFWTKGFLVNTVNPFTFIFWLGVISTYVIKTKISGLKAFVFFSSIMIVIIVADIIKMYLAKTIRKKLKQKHFTFMSRIAGTGLIIFGIVLLFRSHVI